MSDHHALSHTAKHTHIFLVLQKNMICICHPDEKTYYSLGKKIKTVNLLVYVVCFKEDLALISIFSAMYSTKIKNERNYTLESD